jgi:hypothetical protein
MVNAIKRSTYSAPIGYLFLASLLALPAIPVGAQPALAPIPVKDQQKSNQNYQDCVKSAAAAVKSGKLKTQELSGAIAKCGDKFPAAALFNDCKRNVLKNAKGKDISALDFSECKRLQAAVEFNPQAAVPVFVAQGSAFFAGIGLNRDLPMNELQPPNFTCERFLAAAQDIPNKAHHILFGNNARVFAAGPDQAKFLQALKAKAGKPSKGQKFNDIVGFGRVFGDPLTDPSMVYFPSASCDFRGVTGQILSGLSVYYLPDNEAKMATPYFGIAYYKQNQKTVKTPELVAELSAKLGPEFKAYSKDTTTIFISAVPFQEVDRERDPRNICKVPRQHQFVAVIRTLATNTNAPEYLLLANVRNMCDYGDRLARKMGR